MNYRRGKRFSAILALVAGTCGCSLVGNQESQLFSRASRYESASIVYRVEPAPAKAPDGVAQAFYQAPAAGLTGRRMMLAIRYPHPAGKAGLARVELIVEAGTSGSSAWMPAWADRAKRFVNESMPGVSMSGGVQEALALDLAVVDFDRIVERLQHPAPSAASSRTRDVAIVAKVNGDSLSVPNAPVNELDKLIARVRREGRLISHSSETADWEIDLPASFAAKPASSGVVNASYNEPAVQRLPPVGEPNSTAIPRAN